MILRSFKNRLIKKEKEVWVLRSMQKENIINMKETSKRRKIRQNSSEECPLTTILKTLKENRR
jgi:hypothetical protein